MEREKELKPVGLHRRLKRAAQGVGPSATGDEIDSALVLVGLEPRGSTQAAVHAMIPGNRFAGIVAATGAYYASNTKPRWGV